MTGRAVLAYTLGILMCSVPWVVGMTLLFDYAAGEGPSVTSIVHASLIVGGGFLLLGIALAARRAGRDSAAENEEWELPWSWEAIAARCRSTLPDAGWRVEATPKKITLTSDLEDRRWFDWAPSDKEAVGLKLELRRYPNNRYVRLDDFRHIKERSDGTIARTRHTSDNPYVQRQVRDVAMAGNGLQVGWTFTPGQRYYTEPLTAPVLAVLHHCGWRERLPWSARANIVVSSGLAFAVLVGGAALLLGSTSLS